MKRLLLIASLAVFACCSNYAQTSCRAYFGFFAHGSEPVVNFYDSSTAGVNTGDTILSWNWTFGDGSFSTEENPTHTYASAGTYDVCLTITTGSGATEVCESTWCDSVTALSINNGCNVTIMDSILPTISGTNPMVYFVATFTGINNNATYSWSFGDGDSGSGIYADHTYAAPGKYNVCVTAEAHDSVGGAVTCIAYSCDSITIPPSPQSCHAGFTDSLLPNTEYTVQFTNTSSGPIPGGVNYTTYLWTFGDGSYSTDYTGSQHTYTQAGTYNVCITVTNYGSDSAVTCTQQYCDSVTVGQNTNSCTAYFNDTVSTGNPALVGFINLSEGIQGSTNTTYLWTFGDGDSSTATAPTHTYSASGTYTVCVILTSIAAPPSTLVCTNQFCRTITITLPPPTCTASFSDSVAPNTTTAYFKSSYSGVDSNLTYYWGFGDGDTSNAADPSHTYAVAGSYYVCLYVSAHSSSGTEICYGRACDSITIGPLPTCTAYYLDSLVSGSTNTIAFVDYSKGVPGDSTTYSWNFGDSATSSDYNITHTYTNPGTYYACVTVTSYSGLTEVCTNKYCRTITIGQPTTCSVSFTDTALYTVTEQGVKFTASFSGGGVNPAYTWSFGDGATGTGSDPLHGYTKDTSYYVCVTATSYDSAGTAVCTATHCAFVYVTGASGYCYASFKDSISLGTVYFTGMMTGPLLNPTYTWYFGDGSSFVTGADPVHEYATSGTYNVCLEVVTHDSAGNVTCVGHVCDSITIPPFTIPCTAYFLDSIVTGTISTVAFTNHSLGTNNLTTYLWTFGDGDSSRDVNVNHTYSTPGTYTACLTITTPSGIAGAAPCINTFCRTVTIAPAATCSVTFTDSVTQATSGVSGETYVYFRASSGGTGIDPTYTWSFGDGTTGTGSDPVHTFKPGKYDVCVYLTTHDSAGAVTCYTYHCDSITILQTPPPPCKASFTDSVVLGYPAIQFINTSTGITSLTKYLWTFGDGDSSTSSSPDHVYSTPGSYYVCLTITNSDGGVVTCTNEYCSTVEVGPTTGCSVSYTDSIVPTYSGGIVYFKALFSTSTAGTTVDYKWTFGDGSTSTSSDPYHFFTPGIYYVCLYATTYNSAGDAICTASYCDSISITSLPSCTVSFRDTLLPNTPNGVQFINTSPAGDTSTNTTYLWTFGDGDSSTQFSPYHVYTEPGTYKVCLTINTKFPPTTVICTNQYCSSVTVGQNVNCSVTFTDSILPTVSGATGGTVKFLASTTGSYPTYTWYFGDGTSGTGVDPTHTYTSPGTYNVCVYMATHDSAGSTIVICTARYCDSVHIIGIDTCSVNYKAYASTSVVNEIYFSTTATGSDITYVWNFGDGSSSSTTGSTILHTYSQPGEYYVCVSAESHNSEGVIICTATYCDSVTVVGTTPPPCHASFSYLTSTSIPLLVAFTNTSTGVTSLTTYEWTFGDNTASTDVSPQHTYDTTGTYYVCLTITDRDSAGDVTCTSTICNYVTVNNGVNNNCEASFLSHQSESIPYLLYFTNNSTSGSATNAVRYLWTFGDGDSSDLADPTHTYSAAGTYTVCLTIKTIDPNGLVSCTDDTCVSVTVTAPPPVTCNAAFKYTVSSVNDLEVQFQEYATSSGTGLTYTWSFGDGSSGTGTAPEHTYAAAGYYDVCLTVENDSAGVIICTSTSCDTITIGNASYCSASFHYEQSTGNPDMLYFTNSSTTGTGYTYLWTFGDGDSSTSYNTYHIYAAPGAYVVCLTVTQGAPGGLVYCTSQVCDSVYAGSNVPTGPYTISGNIYRGLTGDLATSSMVYLITNDSFNLVAIDSVLAPNGAYTFTNVPGGEYLIKAALTQGATDYADYLPTYYGNVLFWLDATLLDVNTNIASVDIDLLAGTNPGGPGFVGGSVFAGAGKTAGAGGPVRYEVMVLNMDNSPVEYSYSDGSGLFSFSDLAYGTYQIYTEVLGIPTIPGIVTIDAASEVSAVKIDVTTTEVITEVSTGISDPGSIITNSTLFPNPVNNTATVRFDAAQEGTVNITLVNMLGQEMINRNQTVLSGSNELQIDMSGMATGIYMLSIKDTNNKGVIFRVMKE